MPPRPDDAELGLRLAVAAERLNGQLGLVEQLRSDVQRLTTELASHRQRVEPVIDAHGAYLARLQAVENEEAAAALAARRTADERAATARVEEEATRAKARATATEWALRIAVPLLAAALGAGGMRYATPEPEPVHPQPAQEAPGGP